MAELATAPYADDLAYLGDALAALRCRCLLSIWQRTEEGLIQVDALTAVTGPRIDPEAVRAELAATNERLEAGLVGADAEPPALARLQEAFELDDFECGVLLMALAPALDGSFSGLYGRIKGVGYRHPLDVEVVLAVLGDGFIDQVERRQVFARSGHLLTHSLIHLGGGRSDGGDDFLGLELRLPARMVTLLLGRTGSDESLRGVSHIVEPTETLDQVIIPLPDKARIVELVALHTAWLNTLHGWGLARTIPYGRGVIMLFAGPSGTGKTLTARAVANHLGRPLLLVDTARLKTASDGFQSLLDNLLREARLQQAVLFFDECEPLLSTGARASGHLSALLAAMERFDGVAILATNLPEVLDPAVDRRVLYRVNFETPTPSMREAIWRVHLPAELPVADDLDIPYLARRFEFAGGYIKNAVLLAAGSAASRVVRAGKTKSPAGIARVTQLDLLSAAHSQLRHRLNRFADKDTADLKLVDLILPEDVGQQIVEIIEAVSAQQIVFREWGFGRKFNKGRGLSALFDGEPGTGKTLSAEVIAAELGMNLFRVNVSNVVSKYIGETEKNLARVFAEARSAQSVLLFDEADSLFSKRVEVKGANDRFANMEVGMLLQLIERYDGLVILTTNLKTSIDSAFERRLSFKINFPFPEKETRSAIWEHLIPEEAPIDEEVDFELLGDCFELSGGSIKNAVLRAAYRAAARQIPLSMDLFEDAAKRECQAAGKLFRVPRRDDW